MLSIRDCWVILGQSLQCFREFKTTEEDQLNYELQKRTTIELLRRGQEIDRLAFFDLVSDGERLGRELIAMLENAYKTTGGVPLINGPLSYAFVEQVCIPHLERVTTANYGLLAEGAPDDLKPAISKARSADSAIILRQRLATYKESHPIPYPVSQPILLKEKIARLNEELSLLERQCESLSNFLMSISMFDKYELSVQLNKLSMKDILDPEKKYANLSDCIDALHLTVIKEKLLTHEEKNTTLYQLFGVGEYCPVNTLKQSVVPVMQAKFHAEEKIEHIQTILPYIKSLSACLDALSKNITSNKLNYVNSLQYCEDEDVDSLKRIIATLKTTISDHQGKEMWRIWNRWRKSTNRDTFNLFFDEHYNPVTLVANNLSKRNGR